MNLLTITIKCNPKDDDIDVGVETSMFVKCFGRILKLFRINYYELKLQGFDLIKKQTNDR